MDFNTRSLYSILVYLNDNTDGGRTRFMSMTKRNDKVEIDNNTHNGDNTNAELMTNGSSNEQSLSSSSNGTEHECFVKDAQGRFRYPESEVVGSADVLRGSACVFKQDVPHGKERVQAYTCIIDIHMSSQTASGHYLLLLVHWLFYLKLSEML